MQQTIETIGKLERRVDLDLPRNEIEAEVAQRLQRLARESNLPGFRRGKVPVKLVARTHGAQVQAEVLNDKVGAALAGALEAGRVRMAGRPRIESGEAGDEATVRFRATFEVYPEIGPIDVASLAVARSSCAIGEAEIEKTIEVMRRQRGQFVPVARGAQDGDRVTLDFTGTIDGVAFPGGSGANFSFELGRGRMLPEFEEATRGAVAGSTRRFPLSFPADYHGADVAGKKADFEIVVKTVEERELPALDADFARSVGIAGGDLEALRREVRTNVEREVKSRLRTRTSEAVYEALLAAVRCELPQVLVQDEQEHMLQSARTEIEARGGREIPDAAVFAPGAERRVRLSLIVGEIVRSQGLRAAPDQVHKAIEEIAQGYERPAEVVQWYLQDRDRLAEIEATVLQESVVNWVLERARVTDQAVSFDELMNGARG